MYMFTDDMYILLKHRPKAGGEAVDVQLLLSDGWPEEVPGDQQRT